MGDGMAFGWIDWLILGAVLLFILSRFFSFRMPHDRRPRDVRRADFSKMFRRHIPADPHTDDKPVGKVEAVAKPPKADKKAPPVKKVSARELAGMSGLEKIKAMDPAFTEKKFLDGARKAYGYFHTCWNARDEAGLAAFCAPRLVDLLVDRWERKWQKIDVLQLGELRLGEARVSGRTAIVEAVIPAALKVGGVKKNVVSTWVLARPMGSDDPNWELQDVSEVAA